MAKIIMDAFPDILQDDKKKDNEEAAKSKSNANGDGKSGDAANGPNGGQAQNQYEVQNESVIKIFELYHRYYVEVHLPREMELRKVRTKCEQKYNSLRYVSNKKELARREEDEIDWVMMEMKRAIDRLNKEGVFTKEEQQKSKNNKKKSKKKSKKDKDNDDDDGGG